MAAFTCLGLFTSPRPEKKSPARPSRVYLGHVKSTLTEFKTFLLRGNVVDLAVAVVLGTAFGAVIKALVADLLTPIIALIFGKPDFSDAVVHDQQQPLPLRRLHQRPDHVRQRRRGDLLLRRQAAERDAARRAPAARSGIRHPSRAPSASRRSPRPPAAARSAREQQPMAEDAPPRQRGAAAEPCRGSRPSSRRQRGRPSAYPERPAPIRSSRARHRGPPRGPLRRQRVAVCSTPR